MNPALHQAVMRLGTILCLAVLAVGTDVAARTPRARVQQGIIQTIEPQERILNLRPTGQPGLLTIVWNSRTSFYDGTRVVSVAELRKGVLVTVSYHTPFFGERFATKIVIERAIPAARSDRRTP